MSKLSESLIQLLLRQINERGIFAWYDPDRAYTGAVDDLKMKGDPQTAAVKAIGIA